MHGTHPEGRPCRGMCKTIIGTSDDKEIHAGNPDFHGCIGSNYDHVKRQSRHDQDYLSCPECRVYFPPHEWPTFDKTKNNKPKCPCCDARLRGKFGQRTNSACYKKGAEVDQHRISLTDDEKIQVGIIPHKLVRGEERS